MLHIVNRSPLIPSLLARMAPGDALLLIENGVYAARRDGPAGELLQRASGQLNVFALGSDLEARGIAAAEVLAGIRVIDYGGFVDLAVEYAVIQSW